MNVDGRPGRRLGRRRASRSARKPACAVAANRTTPRLLFAVNPEPADFDQLPGGWDLSGGGSTSTARRTAASGSSRSSSATTSASKLEKDAFVGIPALRRRASSWSPRVGSGRSQRVEPVTAPPATTATSTRWTSACFAVDRNGPRALRVASISAGGPETGRCRIRRRRRLDAHERRRAGARARRRLRRRRRHRAAFDVAHRDWRPARYVEARRGRFGRITPTLGLRARLLLARRHVARVDPARECHRRPRRGRPAAIRLGRLSPGAVAAVLRPESRRRAAAHRWPPRTTSSVTSAATIEGAAFFRAEGYVKAYRELPRRGRRARVLEYRVRTRARRRPVHAARLALHRRARAARAGVDTTRRWTSPEQQDRYPLPAGTWKPDFDVPYTGQLVVNAPVSRTVAIGFGWRVAAGRPFTPVIGATRRPTATTPSGGRSTPSGCRSYERFDLSVSTSRPLGSRAIAVFFASVDNVTDRERTSSSTRIRPTTQRGIRWPAHRRAASTSAARSPADQEENDRVIQIRHCSRRRRGQAPSLVGARPAAPQSGDAFSALAARLETAAINGDTAGLKAARLEAMRLLASKPAARPPAAHPVHHRLCRLAPRLRAGADAEGTDRRARRRGGAAERGHQARPRVRRRDGPALGGVRREDREERRPRHVARTPIERGSSAGRSASSRPIPGCSSFAGRASSTRRRSLVAASKMRRPR